MKKEKKKKNWTVFFSSNSNEQILINQAHFVSFALLTISLFTIFQLHTIANYEFVKWCTKKNNKKDKEKTANIE